MRDNDTCNPEYIARSLVASRSFCQDGAAKQHILLLPGELSNARAPRPGAGPRALGIRIPEQHNREPGKRLGLLPMIDMVSPCVLGILRLALWIRLVAVYCVDLHELPASEDAANRLPGLHFLHQNPVRLVPSALHILKYITAQSVLL